MTLTSFRYFALSYAFVFSHQMKISIKASQRVGFLVSAHVCSSFGFEERSSVEAALVAEPWRCWAGGDSLPPGCLSDLVSTGNVPHS